MTGSTSAATSAPAWAMPVTGSSAHCDHDSRPSALSHQKDPAIV
jgi:hypothetical protein